MATTQSTSKGFPLIAKIGIGAVAAGLLIFLAVKAFGKKQVGDIKSKDKSPDDNNAAPGIGAGAGAAAGALSGAANNPPPAPSQGETSDIVYVSPRISGGQVIDTNTIEVRIKNGVFNDGDVVYLHTPQYEGQYPVVGHWDAPDGGGSAFIATPFIDLGTKNSAGLPIDESPGTISVIAQNADSQSADGTLNCEGAAGDTVVEKEYGFSAIGSHKIPAALAKTKHWLTPAEAKIRKSRQKEGKSMGLKGIALRNHIRK